MTWCAAPLLLENAMDLPAGTKMEVKTVGNDQNFLVSSLYFLNPISQAHHTEFNLIDCTSSSLLWAQTRRTFVFFRSVQVCMQLSIYAYCVQVDPFKSAPRMYIYLWRDNINLKRERRTPMLTILAHSCMHMHGLHSSLHFLPQMKAWSKPDHSRAHTSIRQQQNPIVKLL